MPTVDFLRKSDNISKLDQFTAAKTPQTIIKQTPAPGTPVVVGMTIEVEAISFSDVPIDVVIPDLPLAFRTVPLAEVEKLVLGDDRVKRAVDAGDLPEADRAGVAERINTALAGRGLSGTITAGDAQAVVKSLNSTGLFGGR